MTDREFLLTFWDQSWSDSSWFPALSVVFADLTPQQAAWKPAPERHSIWQIVNHLIFWREYAVDRLRGKTLGDDEIERRNFAEPADVSEPAWRETLARLERSHAHVRAALADESISLERLKHQLPHDAYHIGQATYIRALQGLPPHEYS